MTIYLTGATNDYTQAQDRDDLGLLATPASSVYLKRIHYPTWAADNGLFAAESDPAKRERLMVDWVNWITTIDPDGALFATVPDVVGDAEATWLESAQWIDDVRSLGFQVAIVAQNGIENSPFLWNALLKNADVVFLGGSPECLGCGYVKPAAKAEKKRTHCPTCSAGWDPKQYVKLTEWKLGDAARRLTAEAKARGLWVHMGRVNSHKRLAYAESIGCDSADGTYVAFAPDKNGPKMVGWLDKRVAAREAVAA